MVQIPLIGVPKHLWKMVKNLTDASGFMILWRVSLLMGIVLGTWFAFAVSGGSALVGIVLGFAITSILSYTLRDDILAIWKDLWNANWGEAKI